MPMRSFPFAPSLLAALGLAAAVITGCAGDATAEGEASPGLETTTGQEAPPGPAATDGPEATAGGEAAADSGAPGRSGASGGWKVAHWNVQSGFGKAGWTGSCSFRPGSSCSANAWGDGRGPLAQMLINKVKNDPGVVALTLNEAWTCATPERIRSLLGWSAAAPERNGVSIVARYGFAGPSETRALPRCSSSAEQRYVVYAPVYVDAARTRVAHVYATHWTGCNAEADATVDYMQRNAYRPRSLTGDLNVKSTTAYPIQRLKSMNYKDGWATLNGAPGGYTATWNNGYGSPTGNLYKRIDYAFFKTLTARSITRFNHSNTPGTCVIADHAGLVIEYDYPR